MARIVVEIAANAGQAITETDKFTKNLGELQAQLGRLQKLQPFQNSIESFKRGDAAIAATKKRIVDLQTALSGGSQSLAKGSNEAAFALTNLGRVAQDAPFGFIGIQNNLNPLLESFQRLKSESGSTGGALKALVGSLSGPAGLGIALSVVTAGLVLYTQWQQRAKTETVDAAEANEKYIKSLGGLAALTAEAIKEQSKEVASLDLVYRATQNTALGLEERKKAIIGLRALDKDTFKAYTDEQILAGKAAGAVRVLKNELLALGVVRAAGKEIEAQATTIFQNTIKRSIAVQKLADAQKQLNELSKESQKNEFGEGEGLETLQYRAEGLQATIASLNKEIKGYDNVLTDANKKTDQAIAVQDKLVASLGIENVDDGVKKAVEKQAEVLKKAGEKADEYRKRIAALQAQQKIYGLTEGQRLAEEIDKFNSNLVKSLKAKDRADGIDALIRKTKELHDVEIRASNKTAETYINPVYFDIAEAQLKKLRDFNDAASNLINNEIAGTFGGLGDAIGSALAGSGNVLENLSATLLGALGSMLTQLGKLAIATGVGIQAIKTALKTLNPIVAITAGVALVALGSAISKSVSKLGEVKGYANGTSFAPGGIALVGERGPELVNLPRGSAVIPNNRIGSVVRGDNSNAFIAFASIKMEELLIGIKKADKNLNLLGA